MAELTTQPESTSVLNDRDLLRRFAQDADENAFEEIVRRHQGLVLGVCRRVMGNSADVDDAFQATFITLARRPRSVRNVGSLGSWLYTVAWRTSWRMVKKHRKHPVEPLSNQPIAEPDDPLQRIANAQDCLVLDEELNQLPAKYREVLVMTYFSSQTSQQIADQLNVSKGTIDGRIREARNRLRIRLARRGVAIGALAVAAGLSTGTSAMASTTLLQSTIQLGTQTLSSSVPGTTDLSHLEPFINAETVMITSKSILAGLLCTTAVVGIMGMSGLRQEDGEAAGGSGQSAAMVDAVVADAVDEAVTPAPVVEMASAASEVTAKVPEEELILGSGPTSADNRHTASNSGSLFKPYPQDVRPTGKWLYEMLEKPIDLDFPGETPLSEVMEHIATQITTKHGLGEDGNEYHFTVLPDYKELDLESINSLEDVLVRDINFKGMALENALTFLFEQTDPELTYEIRNEVMLITTRAKAQELLVTRVYQVGHLLDLEFDQAVYPQDRHSSGSGFFSVPMQFGAGQGGGVPAKPGTKKSTRKANSEDELKGLVYVEEESLASLIMEMVAPGTWFHEGADPGGAIQTVGTTLVVRQTQESHREIVRLLNLLTESSRKAAQDRAAN